MNGIRQAQTLRSQVGPGGWISATDSASSDSYSSSTSTDNSPEEVDETKLQKLYASVLDDTYSSNSDLLRRGSSARSSTSWRSNGKFFLFLIFFFIFDLRFTTLNILFLYLCGPSHKTIFYNSDSVTLCRVSHMLIIYRICVTHYNHDFCFFSSFPFVFTLRIYRRYAYLILKTKLSVTRGEYTNRNRSTYIYHNCSTKETQSSYRA